ncbi:uncharacterized protein Bfra_009500 [Botrytis fragariae]|uniref:Fungal N-terminal domain-containing protein n=1 Tax=Botrytis fragariae TaxID=1964551 RepID=A0A8H6EG65_9HELO|nr:uncharacterized protein Bfra_009500 [Botrytis fragariae]KAF5870946.1 hypothetical protein Bfra_009500 [Botrytis fragariae]
MDVLAQVSSVISVLSLAIQLAGGIKKAYTLWESVQEASREFQMICKNLRAISNQLMNMVDGIKLDLQELTSKSVETASRDPPGSNVHFDALKVEAQALACSTEKPVSTPTERSLRRKSAFLGNLECSLSNINTPFGTIDICITTLSFADNTYKSLTNLIMHPSRLPQLCGVRLGIGVALSRSYGTLEPELKAHRTVRDDSSIFRLCRDGRIDVIRCLFDEGLASPHDTDSYGRTPLAIAASAGQLSICKFLVDEGADLEVRNIQNNDLESYVCGTWSFDHGKSRGVPFGFSHSKNRVFVPCDVWIEVLRMFIEQFEVSEDPNSSGVIGLRRLVDTTRLVADRKLFLGLLQCFKIS